MMMVMMMIFIDCIWISSRRQWSVVLYKNGTETAQKEKQKTKTVQKHRIHKIEYKSTIQEIKHTKNIKKKHKSGN